MSVTMAPRPVVTAESRAKAKRLRQLWDARKKDLGLTQMTAAKKLGMAQATLSQYLNAVIPLNTDAVIKFSELLGTTASEIDPALKNVQSLSAARDARVVRVRVPLIGSISGRTVLGHTALMSEELPENGVYTGITVDTKEYEKEGIPKGSTILMDVDAEPFVKFRNIMVRLRGEDGFKLFKYLSSTDSSIKVNDPLERRERSIKLSAIAQAHLIYSITMP